MGANDDASNGVLTSALTSDLAPGDYLAVVGGFNSMFIDGAALAGSAGGDFELSLNSNQVAMGSVGGSDFAAFSFSVVPEPSAFLYGGLVSALAGVGYWRKRRLN